MPPSNNNVDVPADKITGQTALPLSRIKKIIQLDEDIAQCSHNATFVIAMATEMFIQYLAQQGHNVVKSERKPRKTIQYKDLATAVSRIDNLEFLSDVIPKTTTYRQFKEKRAQEAAREAAMEKGQRTLNGSSTVTENGIDPSPSGPSILQNQTNNNNGHRDGDGPIGLLPTLSLMVDRTVDNAPSQQDVEMTG
ncbi:hypothetical protein VTN77DRAFT_9058 [Rasamsonia byssochlamydoides]|uniref:uncharacterized protein n=1 Tax=Rasamsonia byssochlamydoides TaxID=89139 RepID=UPI003742576C